MRKTLKVLVCVVVVLCVWKPEAVARRVRAVREFFRREYAVWKVHRPVTGLEDLQSLVSNGDEWFERWHFISHNGGIIQGRLKSDSLEAWELSYSRGNRIIDADMNFTSDNHLVLRHSWSDNLETGYNGQPDLAKFTSSLIFMKYHPMTGRDMINFMLSHDDLFAAVDAKLDPVNIYSALVTIATEMNAQSVLSRVIVSLYDTSDVERVRNVYPFRNFVLRQYSFSHNWNELAAFCVNNNVPVVNVWDSVIEHDPEGVKILTSKGIHVYAAVVNSLAKMKKYNALGVTGAVSDYLSESDWELLR